MPLNLFYTMVQKSQKWPKTQIRGGGSCLKTEAVDHNYFLSQLIIPATRVVVWSWLTFPYVCFITELAYPCSNHVGCFIAGYGGKFRKPLLRAHRQLKSFRYTPGNSGQVLR